MKQKEAPSEENTKKQIEAAAAKYGPAVTINWPDIGIRASANNTAAIMQDVLKQNELTPTLVKGGTYNSPKELADAIASTDQPASFFLDRGSAGLHVVTAQRDGEGGFLVSNLTADGKVTPVRREALESGALRYDRTEPGNRKTSYPTIKYKYPVIFGGKR